MNASVAILFHRFGPYHVARLSAAAKRQKVIGVEVCAIDRTYEWDPVTAANGFHRVTLFSDESQMGKSVARRVAGVLDEHRPSVVAIPGWFDQAALAALRWCLETGTPPVLMSASQAEDTTRRRWKEEIKRRVVRLFCAGLVGGRPQADYAAALGINRERIFKGYDVVDSAQFERGADIARRDESIRRRLQLPERYFLASARFVEKKNLSRLLGAYAKYQEKAGARAWSLVLLGDGPLKRSIEDLVIKLELRRSVLLPGFKQYDDLPAYYGLASAFVHASTAEQWGLVVNEAMSAGLPVIVSERCGCASDLVESGRNGFTFDPYDVDALAELMAKVAADDCDREAMGRASREIISRWGPETFAENLSKAVDAALSAPPARATVFDKALLWALMHR